MVKSRSATQTFLPIRFGGMVPDEYCKQFDKEEYLLEIYKKLGIEVVGENDHFYYTVVLPDDLTIVSDVLGRYVKRGEETLIRFCDNGPFYDRRVCVDEIRVTL